MYFILFCCRFLYKKKEYLFFYYLPIILFGYYYCNIFYQIFIIITVVVSLIERRRKVEKMKLKNENNRHINIFFSFFFFSNLKEWNFHILKGICLFVCFFACPISSHFISFPLFLFLSFFLSLSQFGVGVGGKLLCVTPLLPPAPELLRALLLLLFILCGV